MKLLPLLLLCACSLPDNVGVSTSAGQRDYLSAEPGGWPLTNGTGDSFGVQVWASWQLKPQRMTLVRSAREIDFDFPELRFPAGQTLTDAGVPSFGEADGDETLQPREPTPLTCPACGHEWTP